MKTEPQLRHVVPSIRNIQGVGLLWWVIAVPSILFAVYALRYLLLGSRMYPDILAESFRARPWGIYTHAFFGILGLTVGSFQFRRNIREKYLKWHRRLGKVYLAAALMVGLSGIYMAVYSFGGVSTHLGFGFMGGALLITTAVAYGKILAFDVATHREWMIRSFAIMFGAVTFRLWFPLLMVINANLYKRILPWAT